MLERLFLREEESQNLGLLVVLGFVSGVLGFVVAEAIFPGQSSLISVLFAAVPLIYSLNQKFLEDESERLPHLPEVEMYLSIFSGLALAFGVLGNLRPSGFELQRDIVGMSGAAIQDVGFSIILSNNLTVFASILLVSMLVGSAGAFILSWNASVFGVFIGEVASTNPLVSVAYLPHSLFEMSGFVIAGITGSLLSAAVYRKDLTEDVWRDYARLLLTGIACIIVGAVLETA